MPQTSLALPIDGGTPPVTSDDDVLAIFPVEWRPEGQAPNLSAVVSGSRDLHVTVHAATAYAAGQSDIGRASDQYLDQHATERLFFRKPDELDVSLRTRLLANEHPVSRVAIADAINAILARYTPEQCQVFESVLDRWFVPANHTMTWMSFIERNPTYPERLYPEPGTTPVDTRANSMPGGARVYNGTLGRTLTIRIPSLAGVMTMQAHATNLSFFGDTTRGFYARAGAGSTGTTAQANYVMRRHEDEAEIYAEIIGTVNALRATGIRYTVFVEDMAF